MTQFPQGIPGLEGAPFALDSTNWIFVLAFALAGSTSVIYTMASGAGARRVLLSVGFAVVSIGCVTSGNMLLMLIFWELMLLASYLLIADSSDRSSSAAGHRYLIYHVVAGSAMLLAVLFQHGASGTMAFGPPEPAAIPFFAIGIGIKLGAIPFHAWVPDAYSNVSPAVSVVLSGFTTKVGVYAILRLMLGVSWIPYIGASMALFGALMALLQRCSRRVLGYSIVSQVGYMVVGVGLATQAGIDGGSMHVINHIAYKTLLFMAAGAVIYRVGTGHLPRLGNLARSMPITFVCALFGALAISGVPPFNGFVSKYWIKTALEGYPYISQVLLLAGIGTGASFTKLTWYTYLRKRPEGGVDDPSGEAPAGMLVSMLVLAAFCLYTGILPQSIAAQLPHGGPAPAAYTLAGILEGAWPPFLGVVVFAGLRRRMAEIPVPQDIDSLYFGMVKLLGRFGKALSAVTEDRLQENLLMILAVLILSFFLMG